MVKFGLIGGLGVPAGIYYYRQIVKACEQQDKPLELLFAHAQVQRAVKLVRAGRVAELAEYLAYLLESLSAGGATVAAISAVTPHICIDQLKLISPLPILSILDAVRDELQRRGKPRVALFGTRYVIESDLYGALRGFGVVHPDADEIDTMDRVYQALALRGEESPEERALLNELGRSLVRRHGLDAMLIAGTDLSPVFESDQPDFPVIDCARIHIDAIVRAVDAP